MNDKSKADIKAKEKDSGILKKTGGRYLNSFVKPIAVAKDVPNRLGVLGSHLFSRIKNTKTLLDANQRDTETKLMQSDFLVLMRKWDISESELPIVTKNYFHHCLSGLLGALLLALYIAGHFWFGVTGAAEFFTVLSLTFFLFVSLFLSITSYWRYKVLKDRKFIPFITWFKG